MSGASGDRVAASELTCTSWSGLRPYETQSIASLLAPATAVCLVATIVRLAVFRFAFQPLSEAAVGPLDECAKHEREAHARKQRKVKESLWRACVYFVACAFAAKCFLLGERVDWVHNSTLFWKDWPRQEASADVQRLYALYSGLYSHQLLFLFIDTRTSDFLALLVHHLIVLAIVSGSWAVGFTRIGAFTMLLHDFSDVFLELAKSFKYSSVRHPHLALGADVAFVIFAVSFFALRLGVYPMRVVWSAATEACTYITCTPGWSCVDQPVWLGFNSLLAGLQCLQIFWGWKILGVVWRVLSNQPLDDPRDD